uniref:Fibronectin type-III domain-containing protein n=1 Tax=Gouania willdenowi TaxID=441366 RepID=A0A8C5NGL6_GOUWI
MNKYSSKVPKPEKSIEQVTKSLFLLLLQIKYLLRRQNMKVRITATEDTIVMKFLRPHPNTKLEGYVLGYGSSIFSKQFIPLPEKGQPYMSEMDAEPKYLVAVQPIPTNKLKKHCTGKVQLEKPLHLVIGSVSPTSVLLSWGTLLKTPYDVNVMNECIEDGHYTVRYREKSRKWNYQTCPTSDTIIDNLKPNMVYEFGVQPSTKEGTGDWSRPLYHNISSTVTKGTHFDINENSSIFRPLPASDVDFMGKKRFVAPHVIYKTDKKPDEPCSITSSLTYFPEEEGGDQNVTSPPKVPPSNLTVVTVEGCPSFVILDWEKSDNETREYEVVSTSKGPNGQQVSVQTTNQTHTAVENLKPSSSYEFKVTPKNELGSGPSTDPVSFSTESADPRVSEYVSGDCFLLLFGNISFPFKADSHSECNGKQYVKRTWYRKFVGIQLCNSLRYKIYLSDSLNGKFYNIGDQTGFGEDHCQFVDSFLDGRTGSQMTADQLPSRPGYFRALRQEPVNFGEIGGKSHVTYVGWYECGTPIPGKW